MRVWFFCLILILSGCGQVEDLVDTIDNEVAGTSGGGSTNSSGSSSCGNMNAEACEAFNLVNDERMSRGIAPLQISDNCTSVAQYHAEDMDRNNYFSHDGLNETWAERFTRFGVTGRRGENIAQTGGGPDAAVDMWMNSTGHRENILDGRYRYTGMGHSNGVWVQCFN